MTANLEKLFSFSATRCDFDVIVSSSIWSHLEVQYPLGEKMSFFVAIEVKAKVLPTKKIFKVKIKSVVPKDIKGFYFRPCWFKMAGLTFLKRSGLLEFSQSLNILESGMMNQEALNFLEWKSTLDDCDWDPMRSYKCVLKMRPCLCWIDNAFQFSAQPNARIKSYVLQSSLCSASQNDCHWPFLVLVLTQKRQTHSS